MPATPYVKSRAKLVLLTSLLTLSMASLPGCNKSKSEKDTGKAETPVPAIAKDLKPTYVCPMHPNIVRDHPGHCPICGMALVEKEIHTHDKPDASKAAQAEPAVEKHADDVADTDKHAQPVVGLAPDVIEKLGIRTAKVVRGDLTQEIKTVGYVDYDHDLVDNVSVATAGWVENLSRRRIGLRVQKGELLLELYSPEFLKVQKEYIAAQKKDKSGVLRKYGSRRQSVEPRDALRYMGISDSLQNEIARDGKPRFRIPIYAPRYGEIVALNIKKHDFIPANYAMFTIADLSSVWVYADLYEHQMAMVHMNQKAEVEVNAFPGRKFRGQIYYIDPVLDPKTRTMKVRLLVSNPNWELKPNMFADVRIITDPKQKVLMIPREALIETGKRSSVILDRGGGRFQPVDVVAGMRSDDQVEILSGLKEDDKVVVSGQFLIDSEANLQASFARFGAEK